ncbi:MAG: hypothetical protein HZA51_08555 [Planctomycetes bacterium]|nr:hypothetical protein [Planctomycetota bacterium]
MSRLNQYAISATLESKVSTGSAPHFGMLGIYQSAFHARAKPPGKTEGTLGSNFDEEIIRAFTDVAEGRAVDPVLVSPSMSSAFLKKCKKLGVTAPPALINRRLFRIRKIGGLLPAATVVEPEASIDETNIFAIEFGVVRIKYLYGATIDDMICEPSIGAEFFRFVKSIAPHCDEHVARLGALYLRKTRNLRKVEDKKVESIDVREVECSWVDAGTLNEIKPNRLQNVGPGIIELIEPSRSLYMYQTDTSAASAISQFADSQLWKTVGNLFWTPDLRQIRLRVLPSSLVHGFTMRNLLLRLIRGHHPLFNIPVDNKAA